MYFLTHKFQSTCSEGYYFLIQLNARITDALRTTTAGSELRKVAPCTMAPVIQFGSPPSRFWGPV